MHDSVDERLELVQESSGQVPDVEQVKEAVSDAVKRTTRNYSSNGLESCIHIRYPNNAVSGNLRMIVWSRGLKLDDWYL